MKKINKDGSERRKGSGRRFGSFSFTTIPLELLNSKFKDPQQPIIVSRKFLENLGIKCVSKPAEEALENAETPAPEVRTIDLNAED